MTEENKDLQGIDSNAQEPAEERKTSGAEETYNENTAEGNAPDVQDVSSDEPQAVPAVDEPEAAVVAAAHGGDAEEDEEEKDEASHPAGGGSGRRGGSQLWMGISLLLAILLVISLFKSPFAQKDSEKAVASVNGVKITKQQLYDSLVEAGGSQTLSGMIDDELIRQEAEKANVSITDADIQKERDFYIQQFGSEDALNQLLAQYGMTNDDFQKELEKEAKLRKLLEPKVTVTDDQIQQYFNDNKASFNTPAQVRASQIVVGTEAEAKDIVSQLQGGSDFADLAKSKSTDATTKDNGGDLGFFAQGSGTLDPAIETEAFKLKKDEVSSEPVKLSSGTYAVLKVTDTKEAHTATLDEKKADIKDTLVTQQISQMSASWLDDIRSKAQITNTLDNSAADQDAAEGAAAAENGSATGE